ncbi:MAG: Hsp20/alpha crystallin family protein [Actinobacteria bacterium]|nr:Hsp20/alpha crystallin family protein [Actinomycetota bacterium]MCG2794686.1 Hsp20/alpha crystallin family protein [Actinomycetes bacterium]MBU4240384.1 Hsp20/alpha crystallin family protein [Actinomycetota bacterium]MBU4302677.1 Hsp20/alpha crystallin family protein [Actinomycetota bacterium]MBU4386152.1 Hsp20/alpha crystallin family protein [Actinomycetota bacterium]
MDSEERTRLAGPDEIKKEMERFFEHLERWKRPVFFFEKAWKPRCDVSETKDEVIVVADIAGVASENIDIAVEGNSLVISGIRREPESATRRNYRQMEISYGTFERVLVLPAKVDAERAKADYDDGFLEIRLPKVSPEPPREVEVDVSTE